MILEKKTIYNLKADSRSNKFDDGNILKKIDFPLAMPSANKSTKLSPVKAKDVFDEFEKNSLCFLETL